MYPTLKATVRKGKIELLDDVTLPENATLLITVMENESFESLSLGEHLIAGLEDLKAGRSTTADSMESLERHLDAVLTDL
ncbi:MAG: hypothetical protein GXP42_05870 [Chloroflexi bacterium]|nr:hypothetical protein [Chloroflexota bacterium]